MDVQTMISDFLGSQHGQGALAALTSQGVSPDDATTYLTHAASAGHAHVEEQGSGLLGDHPMKSFFAAFTAGIIKGDGVLGSIGDGTEGVLVAKVTEALASKAGLDGDTASTLAATITPYVASYLKAKLAG
jgi:hypothetical protein